MNPPEPGWYRDPYFKNRERYWDGEVWTDECRLKQPALGSGGRRWAQHGAGAAAAGPRSGPAAAWYSPTPSPPQQPAVAKDPVTTQQPATPPPSDTQPVRIFAAGVRPARERCTSWAATHR